MQYMFYNWQNGTEGGAPAPPNKNQGGPELNKAQLQHAITVHPLKQTHRMRHLHLHFRRDKLADLRYRLLQLRRDASNSHIESSKLRDGAAFEEGKRQYFETFFEPSLLKLRPKHRSQLLHWEFMSPSLIYCTNRVNCPRHSIPTPQKTAYADLVRQLLDLMNRHARQRGRVLEFTEMLYAYRRLDPLHGIDYIVDLLLLYKKFKGKRITVPVRRHAYLQQVFGDMEFMDFDDVISPGHRSSTMFRNSPSGIPEPPPLKSDKDAPAIPTVHIILPLSGRLSTFQKFLSRLEDICFMPQTSKSTPTPRSSMNDLIPPPLNDIIQSPDSHQYDSKHLDNPDIPDSPKLYPSSATYGPCGPITLTVVYFDGTDVQSPLNEPQPGFPAAQSQTDEKDIRFNSNRIAQTTPSSTFRTVTQLLSVMTRRHSLSASSSSQFSADVIRVSGPFSRGRALMAGAEQQPKSALLFLTDVDIAIGSDFFHRARLNTQRNASIYYPIVFSQYNPEFARRWGSSSIKAVTPELIVDKNEGGIDIFNSRTSKLINSLPQYYPASHVGADTFRTNQNGVTRLETSTPALEFAADTGYFRFFGFGILSIYASDLFAIGGYSTDIKGWGLEDVDLFEKSVRARGSSGPSGAYVIVRAPDPDLVHIYHPVECDKNSLPLNQYKMCLGSKSASFASSHSLVNALARGGG